MTRLRIQLIYKPIIPFQHEAELCPKLPGYSAADYVDIAVHGAVCAATIASIIVVIALMMGVPL